jgi:hypothetical protein
VLQLERSICNVSFVNDISNKNEHDTSHSCSGASNCKCADCAEYGPPNVRIGTIRFTLVCRTSTAFACFDWADPPRVAHVRLRALEDGRFVPFERGVHREKILEQLGSYFDSMGFTLVNSMDRGPSGALQATDMLLYIERLLLDGVPLRVACEELSAESRQGSDVVIRRYYRLKKRYMRAAIQAVFGAPEMVVGQSFTSTHFAECVRTLSKDWNLEALDCCELVSYLVKFPFDRARQYLAMG